MPSATAELPAAARLAPPLPAAAPAAPADAAAPVSSARLAVDAVVKLVDAQSGRAQEPVSAVSLNFKFGGDDLAIRVEWRNGEVHTQFRTDSPELRAALASQWQAMAPSAAGRATPFAPPVFSSSGDSASATTGGGPDARQYGQPESSGQPGSFAGTRQQRRSAAARPAAPAAAAPAAAPTLSTVLRLHTFA